MKSLLPVLIQIKGTSVSRISKTLLRGKALLVDLHERHPGMSALSPPFATEHPSTVIVGETSETALRLTDVTKNSAVEKDLREHDSSRRNSASLWFRSATRALNFV